MTGGVHDRRCAWQGMCMAGGMHSKGACMAERGACVVGETATAADGMHPTENVFLLFIALLLLAHGAPLFV